MNQPETITVEPSHASPVFGAAGLFRSPMYLLLVAAVAMNGRSFRKGPEMWLISAYVAIFLVSGCLFAWVQRALARVDRAAVLIGSQLRHYTTSRSVRWLSERLEQCRRYLTTLL